MPEGCSYPQDCNAAEVITEIRVDIGGMRGDIQTMTQLVGEYVKRLDGITQDHEERLRDVEAALARMEGRDRMLGCVKDALIALGAALAGLFGGRAIQ